MPVGKCPLCLEVKELRQSHAIPSAISRSLRGLSITSNPEPLSLTAKVSIQTSRQLQDYVFCHDCEQRFCKNGEAWVLAHMARQNVSPILNILAKASPVEIDEDERVYEAANIPEIDTNQLAYFALSMFWRMAVHDWLSVDGFKRRLDLGSCQESIRQFLLGVGPFPVDCFVVVCVFPKTEGNLCVSIPRRNFIEARHKSFSFAIPGMVFLLLTGDEVPQELKELCCYSARGNPVMVSKAAADQTILLLNNMAGMTTIRRGR